MTGTMDRTQGELIPAQQHELVPGRRARWLLGAIGFLFFTCSCGAIGLFIPFWFMRASAVVLILLGLFFSPGVIADFFTDITPEGINRPTLRGRILLRWSEIRRIQKGAGGIAVRTARHQAVLRYVAFRDPAALIDEIERRIRPSALLSDAALAASRADAGSPATGVASAAAMGARVELRVAALISSAGGLILAALLLWPLPGTGMEYFPGIAIGGTLGLLMGLWRPWFFAGSFQQPPSRPLRPDELTTFDALRRLHHPRPILAIGAVFALAMLTYALLGHSYIDADMREILERRAAGNAFWYNVGLYGGGLIAYMLLYCATCAASYLALLRAIRLGTLGAAGETRP
jgi:MFS family permease